MHISTKLNSFHRSPPDSNINLGTFHDKGVGGGEGWKGKKSHYIASKVVHSDILGGGGSQNSIEIKGLP